MIKVLIIKGIVNVYVSKNIFLCNFFNCLSCGVLLVFSVFLCCFPRKYVYIIRKHPFSPLYFFPFCGGKSAIGGTFLVLREPNSTNNFVKKHFSVK